MSAAWLIVRRELSSYFKSPMGYIVGAGLLWAFGILFIVVALHGAMGGAKERLSADVLQDFFYFASGLVMFASVLLSMRLFAEERQAKTLVLLYTAPIKEWQIVLGKYLSAFIMVSLIILLSLYMPTMILLKGNVSWGHIFAGYVGLLSLGAATTALGTFGSAVAKNQVIAVLISASLVFLFVIFYFLTHATEPPIKGVIGYLDLYSEHFGPTFRRGIIRMSDLVYYGSLVFVSLLGSAKVLSARRWVG